MPNKETAALLIKVGREALNVNKRLDRTKAVLADSNVHMSDSQRKLLVEQLDVLRHYSDVLKRRIDDLTFTTT